MEHHVKHHMCRITKDNIEEAIAIRCECYLQDYAEILPSEKLETYDYNLDLKSIAAWFFETTEDYRAGYLYYIDQKPVGMVMGSMADLGSYMEAVELNYLFVSEKARGLGVGRKLMTAMAIEYRELGVKSLLLYNWRDLKSNGFYRHLEPDSIETIVQHPSGKALETDIFSWEIKKLLSRQPLDKIVWFSGTGGVQHVAEQLRLQLLQSGKLSIAMSISECLNGQFCEAMNEAQVPTDRLFLLFPVYAMAEPPIVKSWLEQIAKVEGAKAVVLSVSGGGEVWPNTSCRRSVIDQLSRKGYQVIYERMLVMPPNIFIEAEPDLVTYLMKMLPLKLKDILLDLDQGTKRRDRLKLSTCWLRVFTELEQRKARNASQIFKISEHCSHCGHCVEYCPVNNIHMGDTNHIPVFENNCQLCLKCYYGCPVHAIEAPKLQKWLLSQYDMSALKQLEMREPEKKVADCCKGLLWLGVKKYLEQIKF